MINILEEEYQCPNYEYVTEYMELIEFNIDNIPDKRKKEYKIWIKRMNDLVNKCNKLAGDKIYKQFRK